VVPTIRTSLSQLLRIDLPIVQAPIVDATPPVLAAARGGRKGWLAAPRQRSERRGANDGGDP
jgi:hypothetical protein